MREFPAIKGTNCFMEIIKGCISYNMNKNVEEKFIFAASGNISFPNIETDCEELEINITQRFNVEKLREWLNLRIQVFNCKRVEEIIVDVKERLYKGDIPIINIGGRLIPSNKSYEVPITYAALHNYNPDTETMSISCIYYNGEISMGDINSLMRSQYSKNSSLLNWMLVEVEGEDFPELDDSYLLQMLRSNLALNRADILNSGNEILKLSNLLHNLNRKVIKNILLENLNMQMSLPWGPLLLRKQMYEVLISLNKQGITSKELCEKYSYLCNKWENVRMLLAKTVIIKKNDDHTNLVNNLKSLSEKESSVNKCLISELLKDKL